MHTTMSLRTTEQLLELAVTRISALSRTVQGVSDTSVSSEKQPCKMGGEQLATQAQQNLREAIRCLATCFESPPRTVAEVEALFMRSIEQCNKGLLPSGALLRSWRAHEKQLLPEELPEALHTFYREYLDKITTPGFDSRAVAAWIEQRFDHQIHPLYDGCGRVARAHAAAVLLKAGIPYPEFPSRDQYLAARAGEFKLWLEFYTAHIR